LGRKEWRKRFAGPTFLITGRDSRFALSGTEFGLVRPESMLHS
jgi:hypothetical protein